MSCIPLYLIPILHCLYSLFIIVCHAGLQCVAEAPFTAPFYQPHVTNKAVSQIRWYLAPIYSRSCCSLTQTCSRKCCLVCYFALAYLNLSPEELEVKVLWFWCGSHLCWGWARCHSLPAHLAWCPELAKPHGSRWHGTDSGSEHWPMQASH